MKRLIIIGAGGHGKVIADNAVKNGYTQIAFLDDRATGDCMGFPIVGKSDAIETLKDNNTCFVIGIGDNAIRKQIVESFDAEWGTIVHPSAQIASTAVIGAGTVVMAGAVINAGAVVGEHCIINTGAVVEHDNYIEDYVHISPKAVLGGTVYVGQQTHIGIGATVINNINICRECVIGAGATVVKNIEDRGTYVGVPALMLK